MTTIPQLTASLTSQSLPAPTPTFLTPILHPPSTTSSTRSNPPPLAVLTATAKHRLLHTSISSTPSPLLPTTPSLPPDIANIAITERVLNSDVFVQVLDVVDVGRSRWEQIEALESVRKGEGLRGREIVRVVPGEANAEASSAGTQVPNSGASGSGNAASKGPFKLLLQDWKGTTIYAFELKKVDKIAMPPAMGIGCKVLLKKGCKVARGMVLLEPERVLVFGGRIEGLDKAWREGREARLREEVQEQRPGDESEFD